MKAQDRFLNQHSIAWIKEQQIPENAVVADIGCGQGGLTIEIAKLIPLGKVIAVDNSQAQLNIAQSLAAQQGVDNIEWRCADITKPIKDMPKCDAVHCRWLLSHLAKPIIAFENMAEIAKPEGKILIEEPGGDNYEITPAERSAPLVVWLAAANFVHYLENGSRSVALELLEAIPQNREYKILNVKTIETTISPETGKTHFRLGIERIKYKLPAFTHQAIDEAIKGWKEIEHDETVFTSRTIRQISVQKIVPQI